MLSNSLKSGANISSNGVFALFTEFDVHNYVQAWSGIDTSLLNTVIVAAAAIVIGVVAAVLGAYAFAQVHFRGKSVVFLAYLGLLMIPWTLTIIPLFLLMKTFGFYNGWWALILPYAASAQPLLVLLFRGFFEQIPDELLQSARLDGAREWQVLLRVVAPLTRPIILTGADLDDDQRLGRLPVADDRLAGLPQVHDLGRAAGVRQRSGHQRHRHGRGVRRLHDHHAAAVRAGRLLHALLRSRNHRRRAQTLTPHQGPSQ